MCFWDLAITSCQSFTYVQRSLNAHDQVSTNFKKCCNKNIFPDIVQSSHKKWKVANLPYLSKVEFCISESNTECSMNQTITELKHLLALHLQFSLHISFALFSIEVGEAHWTILSCIDQYWNFKSTQISKGN